MSPNTKSEKAKYNLRSKNLRKSKDDSSSSSEDDDGETLYTSLSDTNSDENENSEVPYNLLRATESANEFETNRFCKALYNVFPSKYLASKIADFESSEKSTKHKKNTRPSSPAKKHKKRVSANTEPAPNERQYNIVIIGDREGDEDGEGYFEDDEDDEEYDESDDDAECNSDDEKTFMKETYEEVQVPGAELTKSKQTTPSDNEYAELVDIENEYAELVDLKKQLTLQLQQKPNNKILKRSIEDCTESIRALVKKTRKENTKKYHKLIHVDTKPANEIDYFKTKLSNKEQRKAMEDLQEINAHIYIDKPYRLALLQSKMPAKFKAIAMQKLNILRTMEPSEHEYYKIKNWVDTFMKIPFGLYKSVSVSMDDGLAKCNEFMTNAKQTLDDCTYGLNDAKMQIMQMLGQWIVNPTSLGTSIAIHGPMGTGKTTLVKEGISKILGREFTFIALGGSGDASFLEGHSYTYEGSTWGKIVQILVDSKCMNPVFYFDELDKVSDTPRGQEIIGILTHLTDTTQNSQFHDKYFSEIDFDLSKCLFIFSYNDETMINPILRDRMYHIRTAGYESADKVVIARNHLLPKIWEQVSFTAEDVVMSDDIIRYIIATFTKNESGVRNLKRCFEMIYSKLNLFRLITPENKLFAKELSLDIAFPITITRKEVDMFIKKDEVINQSMLSMYI